MEIEPTAQVSDSDAHVLDTMANHLVKVVNEFNKMYSETRWLPLDDSFCTWERAQLCRKRGPDLNWDESSSANAVGGANSLPCRPRAHSVWGMSFVGGRGHRGSGFAARPGTPPMDFSEPAGLSVRSARPTRRTPPRTRTAVAQERRGTTHRSHSSPDRCSSSTARAESSFRSCSRTNGGTAANRRCTDGSTLSR